ncbi:MAG: hypothetical protein WC839_01080 [Candidatus Paceibacterota bacterium]
MNNNFLKIKNKTHFLKFKRNSGYAILETVFYIALFAILTVAVIDALLTMTKSFKETSIHAELMQGGDIMEKISRETRQAYGINAITSTSLKLNTKDSAGTNKTVEFSLSGLDIRFLENDTFIGNLNTQNISISNITFTQINTAKGVAIKVFLTIRSLYDSLNRDRDFYNTIVLRGSY